MATTEEQVESVEPIEEPEEDLGFEIVEEPAFVLSTIQDT
jgi:hypothetical protein